MKFSTTPILLTSLAFSSTAAFGAPLPPVPGSSSSSYTNNNANHGIGGNSRSNLNVGVGKSRSPNPDEYSDSPRIASPLLGVGLGSTSGSGSGLGVGLLNVNSNNGGNGGNGGLGLDLGVGGLIGIGGKGRPAKRQTPPIPSSTNPMIPSNAGVPIPTSVPMVPQSANSGIIGGGGAGGSPLDISQITGLPKGLAGDGIANIQGLTGTAAGLGNGLPLQGLTGTVGGLVNGLPLQGLTGTVGGLTNGLPLQGLTGTLGGLTNGLPLQGLTGTIGGLTNGLPLQSLTGTIGGLTNGLPIQGLTNTVGGLTNGLPLQGLTGTVGGLTNGLPLQGLTGTLNGLTNNLPLQGVTGTVGSLTKGLPIQGLTGSVQGLASSGPLSGLTGPLNGVIGSLSTDNPSGSLNNLPQDVTSASSGGVAQTQAQAQGVNNIANPSATLGNIVQSLGSNTYLLSSGQILKLASDISSTTGTSGSIAPLLNGLRSIEIEGRMYIVNPAGQLVGTLTNPINTSTVGLYSDSSSNPDSGSGSSVWGSDDDGSSANQNGAGLEDGWNNPYPGFGNGLLPLSSQPDATELVAQSMKGYEPPKSYLSSSSSSTPADSTLVDDSDSSALNLVGDDATSEGQYIPQPDNNWGSMTGSRLTTGVPSSAPIPAPTAAPSYTEESSTIVWGTAAPTLTLANVPTSSITSVPTASITSIATPAEGWGEWVTGGVPTALPTAYYGGNNDWNDDGAVGSEMVPQTSAGLA